MKYQIYVEIDFSITKNAVFFMNSFQSEYKEKAEKRM